MKAISIRQPWAALIASGEKTIELRTWATSHRGPLLVCAAAKSCGDLPTGVAICIVDLLDVRPARKRDASFACSPIGDYTHSWILGRVSHIDPFHVSGKLGLFDVTMPD